MGHLADKIVSSPYNQKNKRYLQNYHDDVVKTKRHGLMDGKHVTMHIKGIGIDLNDGRGRLEYLLPSFDPETGKIMTGNQMFEKFFDDIKAGKVEGYKDRDLAEKDRELMYPEIIGLGKKKQFSSKLFRNAYE